MLENLINYKFQKVQGIMRHCSIQYKWDYWTHFVERIKYLKASHVGYERS
jgi:hypothetical protein